MSLLKLLFFRLPRIRGGVSSCRPVALLFNMSSPHTRGCFLIPAVHPFPLAVFPAYAGVFLYSRAGLIIGASLPRIRGGVSAEGWNPADVDQSSPHTRGCFHERLIHGRSGPVFPAYAGVFLPQGVSSPQE